MDLDFIFFRLPQALQFMFKFNYIPQKSDFKELTDEQYASFYSQEPAGIRDSQDQKIYVFLPDEPNVYNRVMNLFGDDLVIVSESELMDFHTASIYIDNLCDKSNRHFESQTEKLTYIARILPDVFIEGTPFFLTKMHRDQDRVVREYGL